MDYITSSSMLTNSQHVRVPIPELDSFSTKMLLRYFVHITIDVVFIFL